MRVKNCFVKFIIFFPILIVASFVLVLNVVLASENNFNCHSWSTCSPEGEQTRICQSLEGPKAGMTFVKTRDCTPEQKEQSNLNPVFDKIEPEIIMPGESVVQISGSDFGNEKGDSYVALVDTLDYNYISDFKEWSNSRIEFYAPDNIDAHEIGVRIGDETGKYHTFKNYYIQPIIKSIEPVSGYTGDTVKIDLNRHPNEIFPGDPMVNSLFSGENIKNEVTINVYFNGTKVSNITSDEFGYYNVKIPQGASSGKITVELYTPSSPKIKAVSENDFIVKNKIDCSIYGEQAYYDDVNESCNCKWGYKWNDNKTNCIKDVKEITQGDDPDNDGAPSEKDLFPEQKSEIVTRNYSFQYKMPGDSRGDYVNFEIDIPKDLYLYYQNENHSFSEDFNNITTFVTQDDPVIINIANQISEYKREKGLNPVALMLQLVGEIIYTDDKFSIKGWDEYPKYPVETILDKKGDCEDNSFLMASLFKALDLSEPLLVKFDNHLGISVIASKGMIDSVIEKWGYDFMHVANEPLKEDNPNNYHGFIYLETTGNVYWSFGYMPEELRDKEYELIPIYDNSVNNYNEHSDNNTDENNESKKESIVQREKNSVQDFDKDLSKRVGGKILLQVESDGEGWYVNPDDEKKYYLGKPLDVIRIMRKLGLGISEDSFDSFNGYAPKNLAGKILLRVKSVGEAYYVNPEDLKMHYLGKPIDALMVMRNLGLGISNNDLRKIEDVGNIKNY